MVQTLRFFLISGLCVVLAACTLPRGAALQSEIVDAADDVGAPFAVYPVTRNMLPSIALWPQVGEAELGWISHSHGGLGQILRVGDAVDITIWDSSENSLLVGLGGRNVTIPAMRISPEGAVFLPYVGPVQIAGMSPQRARETLQASMGLISPSAQVQLTASEGRSNSVDLVGGVAAPGSYPLVDQNYSVLSLISAAGGVPDSINNPQIRLHRAGKVYGTSMRRLFAEPALDTRLRGGDQVVVQADERSFLSIGATGVQAQHAFPQDLITGLDALAIVGGVNASRANLQGLLVLREYPAAALAPGRDGPRQSQVVFTVDLSTADGLFAARNFRVMPGDVVYATESPVTNVRTIFGLIGQAFGVADTLGN
jgi:polysaccharide export outer membrane protein